MLGGFELSGPNGGLDFGTLGCAVEPGAHINPGGPNGSLEFGILRGRV